MPIPRGVTPAHEFFTPAPETQAQQRPRLLPVPQPTLTPALLDAGPFLSLSS